jgi:hypothetical protein
MRCKINDPIYNNHFGDPLLGIICFAYFTTHDVELSLSQQYFPIIFEQKYIRDQG